MRSYRQNYSNDQPVFNSLPPRPPPSFYDIPPPPPPQDLPPLPRGPPPPYETYRNDDRWRPQSSSQSSFPQNEFTFRTYEAPQYPHEQNQPRPVISTKNSILRNRRPRAGEQSRDGRNLNQNNRGTHFRPGQRSRAAPSDRPLLRHREEGESSGKVIGMTEEQAGIRKFMPADDVSDSDEEQMDESDSEADDSAVKTSSNDHGVEQIDDEGLEPPSKRRAMGLASHHDNDETNVPKWSNPDPYTVLPPVGEEAHKRKDVVKLIRKANQQIKFPAQSNQVAANDDFISFGFGDEEVSKCEEASPRPSSHHGEYYARGFPRAPLGPRQVESSRFSHLQNLHSAPSVDASKRDGGPFSNDSIGASAIPIENSSAVLGDFIIDTGLPDRRALKFEVNVGDVTEDAVPNGDEALGNRKRTHDDIIKNEKVRSQTKNLARRGATVNGSLLQEWLPDRVTDPTPWLRRTGTMTANAGFRLHKEVCDFYDFVKPRSFEHVVREELLSRLQNAVSKRFPHCNVHSFGSFAAGLYLPNADMDVVVISDSYQSSGQKVCCQTKTQLHHFGGFVRSSGLAQSGSVEVIVGAKVPLIKFIDRVTAIRVDVSFENDTGIIANDTFALWKKLFPAMPILVTVIKQFLMMRGMNEVMHGGLGGFSVTCLVTSLLQNMPRVQTGELIPEQNLGEVLIEFLDFYGNRLDTSRTGVMMNPPGYFDKQAYRRPNFRGPPYQASKAYRLAIIDPNKPENDISGGSHQVKEIFGRFARAHSEILGAMRAPNRLSLLDWSLGGNYGSFIWQRNHLLDLFKQRWGSPEQDIAGPHNRCRGPGQSMPGVVQPLAEVQANILHGEHTPSDGTHKSSGQEIIPQKAKDYSCKFTDGAANCQAMGHDTQKLLSDTVASTIREAGQEIEPAMIGSGSKKPKPQTGPQRQECRAAKLKKLYPDMTGIPDKVSQGFKRKLIANLGVVPPEDREEKKKQRQRALSLKKQYPDMAGIPEFVSPDLKKKLIRGGEIDGDKNKERQRASDLKKRFPQMQGIPDQISKAAKNILVAEYQAKLKAPAGPAKAKKASGKKAKLRARLADLPPRPAAPPSNPKSTYPIRQFARLKRENADSITISGKVAPLSDKRRDQKSAPSAQLPSRPIPRHHNSVYRNTSDKMAPLSNERRAEVAMNLRGHTGLDPIMID